MMKLVVGMPWDSAHIWRKPMEALLNQHRPQDVEIEYVFGSGWCPARRHVSICEQALAANADLICICGADQVHPRDMLVKLIRRHFETCGGVITALIPFRGFIDWVDMKPFQPMGWRLENPTDGVRTFQSWEKDRDMAKVIDPADGELQRVHLIGSGVLLFHRDHLLALKKPWFFERADENMNRVADQDSRFVWRLQIEAGAKVYVDTTIKVRHVHDLEIDESFQNRFNDWMEPGKGDPTCCKYGKPATPGTAPTTANS